MKIEKLYIARDSKSNGNHLYLYNEEPRKDKQEGIWRSSPDTGLDGRFEWLSLPDSWFPEVTWKDKEATEVTLTALVKQKEISESRVEVSNPVGNGDCHRDCRNCTGEFVCPGNIND